MKLKVEQTSQPFQNDQPIFLLNNFFKQYQSFIRYFEEQIRMDQRIVIATALDDWCGCSTPSHLGGKFDTSTSTPSPTQNSNWNVNLSWNVNSKLETQNSKLFAKLIRKTFLSKLCFFLVLLVYYTLLLVISSGNAGPNRSMLMYTDG